MPTGGNKDVAIGRTEMEKGIETAPCALCESFNPSKENLRRYMIGRGFKDPDGTGRFFESPLTRRYIEDNRAAEAENIQRKMGEEVADKSLLKKARPRLFVVANFGMCKKLGIPAEHQASCEDWAPSKKFQKVINEVRKGRGPKMLQQLMKGEA